MPQLDVKLSSWSQIWPECEPLLAAHRKEVRERELLPFKVDAKAAQMLEDYNQLVVCSARFEGGLIGYSIWFLSPCLESEGYTVASQGPWYVKPDFRGSVGTVLWDCAIERLRELGVAVIYPHHWMHGKGPRLGEYFKSLGAYPLEMIYEMEI